MLFIVRASFFCILEFVNYLLVQGMLSVFIATVYDNGLCRWI